MTDQSNQSAKHQSLIDALGASFANYDYNSAFHAYWDSLGIAQGTFNERMVLWVNQALSTTYDSIVTAMNQYAIAKGASNWDSLGNLQLSGGASTAGQPIGLLLALTRSS